MITVKQKHKFVRDACVYSVEVVEDTADSNRKHGRAFVFDEDVSDQLDAQRILRPLALCYGLSTIYTDREANPQLNVAWDALNTLVVETKRAHLALAYSKLDGMPATQRPRFSIKAGCTMCPCSPGFIIEGLAGNLTINVTVKPSKRSE